MYKIEEGKAFYATLRFLDVLVIFPSTNFKTFFLKFSSIRVTGIVICFILPTFHLVTSIRDGLKAGVSEDLSVILGSVATMVSSFFFIYRAKKWFQFFSDVTDFEKYGKYSGFDKVMKRMNVYSNVMFWYMFLGFIGYGVISFPETSECKEINKQGYKLQEVCGSFIPIRLPFDGSLGWIRWSIFFTQMIVSYVCLVPNGVLCFMTLEASEFVITHICLLKEHLAEIFEPQVLQERSNRLRFCINYHNHILSLSDRLNYLVKVTVGHMSLVSAIIFGCIGSRVFDAKPLGAAIYLVGYVAALFCLCHAGQRVMDETTSVGASAYDSGWFDANASMMQAIQLMVLRSQTPSTLDALPLGSLDYPLFLMVMKTSYSYVTLLSQSTS